MPPVIACTIALFNLNKPSEHALSDVTVVVGFAVSVCVVVATASVSLKLPPKQTYFVADF